MILNFEPVESPLSFVILSPRNQEGTFAFNVLTPTDEIVEASLSMTVCLKEAGAPANLACLYHTAVRIAPQAEKLLARDFRQSAATPPDQAYDARWSSGKIMATFSRSRLVAGTDCATYLIDLRPYNR